MSQISTRIQTLEPSPIVTFIGLASQHKSAINFVSGSPGHGSIPGIQSAINSASIRDVSLYRAPHYGSLQARKHAAEYFQNCYGLGFDPKDEINLTTGFTHLFFCLCTTLLNPGDTVLLIEPSFPQYQQPIELAGGKIVTIPTTEKDLWKPRPEAIKAAFEQSPNAKLIIFNYPNNPSGATLDESEWQAMMDVLSDEVQRREAANATPLLILLDDAYVPLFHGQSADKSPTFGRVLQQRLEQAQPEEAAVLNRLLGSALIVCTLSKQGSAGTLLGLGASKNRELLKYMRVPQKATVICPNAMGELALSALVQPDEQHTIAWARGMYAERLQQLGLGLNTVLEQADLPTSGSHGPPVITIPVAGMYCYANFLALKGISVSGDFLERVQSMMPEKQGASDGEASTAHFKNNQINTNFDVAVWLLLKAGISTIPMGPAEKCCVRFSVSLPQAIAEKSPQEIDRIATEQRGKQLIDQALTQLSQSLLTI
ncbi:MAG: pyridoxal phosphate-dependent aminotransferase [Cyanobacteria bacterium J06555_13]